MVAASNLTETMARAETEEPTIQITHRRGRSFQTTVIQLLIRPIRPHLAISSKISPAGSVPLKIPHAVRHLQHIEEAQVCGVYIYNFSATLAHREPRHRLLYFAGGGYQSPPHTDHWRFVAELSKKLPGYRIGLVSYPLAPNNTARTALNSLQDVLLELLEAAQKHGHSISLMGDSSGANIAISIALKAAKTGKATCLRNVLAISPPVDFRNLNKEISEAQHHDPLMTSNFTSSVACTWAGKEWPLDHEELSLLLADLNPFREADIKVHGVIGTYDVLAPDAITFVKKLKGQRVTGEWLEWEGQMHVFPILIHYKLPESIQAKDWIVDVLNKNV